MTILFTRRTTRRWHQWHYHISAFINFRNEQTCYCWHGEPRQFALTTTRRYAHRGVK